jgi:hypothetical protein
MAPCLTRQDLGELRAILKTLNYHPQANTTHRTVTVIFPDKFTSQTVVLVRLPGFQNDSLNALPTTVRRQIYY